MKEIAQIINDYLAGDATRETVIDFCKSEYEKAMVKGECLKLSSIITLPFVHEFAYWNPWNGNEKEFRERAIELIDIINCKNAYEYSVWIRNRSPRKGEPFYDLARMNGTPEMKELRRFFSERFPCPQYLDELLHNTIFDYLSIIEENGEDGFDSLNCDEEDYSKEVFHKLSTMLDYLLGKKCFYLHVILPVQGEAVYLIV
jgi:hypothetical protein